MTDSTAGSSRSSAATDAARPGAAAPSPTLRRNLVTICAMTATIMQALDTTIANVALPYMQGSLSASYDQVTWVLTSYIVAAAIATAPVGWLSERFGRKKLFIICAAGFTVASILCGLAQNIGQMVAFRLLQGVFGAALVPLSQAVMLDSYPPHQRGQAMAIWGMGVMLGPIMGPTLGGWLTETYSWHWVFLINLPFGIVTVVGLTLFLDESAPKPEMRFDWAGFAALSIGIGAFQLMLDRGEQLGWFESPEIVMELIVAVFGVYYFLAHSFTTARPFIDFALFRDRNFSIGCIFMVMIGLILFSSMALLTPFLQNLMGLPIFDAGIVIGARGVGTFLAMMITGRLLQFVEARYLILIGFLLNAISLYEMTGFTDQTTAATVMRNGLMAGFGLGFVFVPLSTVAFLTLPQHLRTAGASILTLVRNVASSVGISLAIASLTSTTTAIHARLTESVTPFNPGLQMLPPGTPLGPGTDQGMANLEAMVARQASIIAFENVFLMLMWVCIIALPFVLLVGSSRAAMRQQAGHVME
ncbi:MAG TPA: DHA2 family efflux MFS transporter permease subunit [Xanthobacteraceae bacterium]|nr:DHA2 family efflux MFS transporter permease subunit [Xanthobacteraceae bacterium]